MVVMEPPCKWCEDRQAACHSTCERYKAYRQRVDEVKKRRAEEHLADDDLRALDAKRSKRYRHYRRYNK